MLWFPVRMRRNVAVYIAGFAAYFASRWVSLMVINLKPEWVDWANLFSGMVSLICLLYWTLAIRPEGESMESVSGIRWDPAELERLSRQLEAINSRLVRFNQ
jgi:hypothetical protein